MKHKTQHSPFHRRSIYVIVCALGIVALAGCGMTVMSSASGDLPAVEPARGISQSTEPLPAEPPQHATSATMPGRADRLAVDVGRAMDKSHWGRLHVRAYQRPDPAKNGQDKTASEPQAAPPGLVVHARALVPGSRTATVVAWAEEDGHITAAVRVGYFGNPDDEAAFLETLRKLLQADPPPKRQAKFQLPPNWPGLADP